MVKLDPNDPFLFVDSSYFVFYRYFSIFNWYRLSQKQTVDVPNVLTNTEFMQKFDKLFEDNLEKLRKKHNVPYNNVVFCKDCIRDRIWRYKHYPNYKKSRDERLATFNGDIFKHCYGTLLPDLHKRLGIQWCEHPIAEADDVIAVFTRELHARYPDTKITIVTNDNDYLQLITDNVQLVNMKNVDLKDRLSTDPMTYLLQKIIMGDKSDNILSVFPKCGEKKALQLAKDKLLLQEKLSKSAEFKERFELNTLLIDTRLVPDEIQREILQLLELPEM